MSEDVIPFGTREVALVEYQGIGSTQHRYTKLTVERETKTLVFVDIEGQQQAFERRWGYRKGDPRRYSSIRLVPWLPLHDTLLARQEFVDKLIELEGQLKRAIDRFIRQPGDRPLTQLGAAIVTSSLEQAIDLLKLASPE